MLRELTLRELGPDDEPALAVLFAENDRPEVTRWFDPFPLTAATARALSRDDGRDLYWGAWSEAGLVGFAMVRGWEGDHPEAAYGCLVDRRHQGRGVGRTLTALALEQLRQRRVPEVRARVHDDNPGSLRMHRAAGFEELERGAGRVILVARPRSSRWS
jgi:RimJ/RimL family protein N-acetyltransferase